jgi:hypothetical protein
MSARRLTVSRQYPQSRAARSRYLPIAPMPFPRLKAGGLMRPVLRSARVCGRDTKDTHQFPHEMSR